MLSYHRYPEKRQRPKVAHTASRSCFKTSSVEANTSSIGSAFQGFTKHTSEGDAQIAVLIYGSKNIQGWPLRFLSGSGANNLSMCRLVTPW